MGYWVVCGIGSLVGVIVMGVVVGVSGEWGGLIIGLV